MPKGKTNNMKYIADALNIDKARAISPDRNKSYFVRSNTQLLWKDRSLVIQHDTNTHVAHWECKWVPRGWRMRCSCVGGPLPKYRKINFCPVSTILLVTAKALTHNLTSESPFTYAINCCLLACSVHDQSWYTKVGLQD